MATTQKVKTDIDLTPVGVLQTLITGASVSTIIHSVYITNVGLAETVCNVAVDDGGVIGHLAANASIPIGQSLILDKPVYLEPGNTLKADGANIHIVVSYLERT